MRYIIIVFGQPPGTTVLPGSSRSTFREEEVDNFISAWIRIRGYLYLLVLGSFIHIMCIF